MKIPSTLKTTAHNISTPALTNGRMEAIAWGVQARLEERTGFFRRVTDETIDIARALGVADKEINIWVDRRLKQLACDDARLQGVKAILERIHSGPADDS